MHTVKRRMGTKHFSKFRELGILFRLDAEGIQVAVGQGQDHA